MSIVHFGGCFDGTDLSTAECSVDPASCTDAEHGPTNNYRPYTSSFDLWGGSTETNKGCSASQVSAVNSGAGLCGDFDGNPDGFACVNTKDACGSTFVPQQSSSESSEKQCGLVADSVRNVVTLYGACQRTTGSNSLTCAFDASSCNAKETYLTAQAVLALGEDVPCTCENTYVGLCDKGIPDTIYHFKDHIDHYCAVNERQCVRNRNETFVSRTKLANAGALYGLNKCFVCDGLPAGIRTTSFTSATSSTSTNNIPIYIIVSVVVTACILLVPAICILKRRKRNESSNGERQNEDKSFFRIFSGFFT